MKVLVTGGAGFIGANLCDALARASDVSGVVALDDLSTGSEANLAGAPNVELTVGSVLDQEVTGAAVEGADAVVHLAARPSVPRSLEDPWATHQANASGTLAVLEAVRRRPPGRRPYVIVASSSSVYGVNPALPKREDMTPMPASPYAASKLAAEAYALAYGRCFDVPVLVFRFFNVFGPLQSADHAYAAVVPTFVAAALRGDPLTIHGDGRQTRDFTFVGSVVAVLAEALRRRETSATPINLAFGSRTSVLELAGLLGEVVGRPLAVHHVPPRPGDVRDSQADREALERHFGAVAPVPLTEGLRATVDWFRHHAA